MIVPKSKRTIFLNNNKYFLNLPDLLFEDKRHPYVWIIKDNQKYHVPLPNIAFDGFVCMPTIDSFFESQFNIQARDVIKPSEDIATYKTGIHYSINLYIKTYNTYQLSLRNLQYFLDNPIKK